MHMIRWALYSCLIVGGLGTSLACNGVDDETTTSSSAPTITSFSTSQSLVNNSIHIYGTYLTGAKAVSFNGVQADESTLNVLSSTDLTVKVPEAASTGKISVTTSGGTATSSETFSIAPAITSISPTSGSAGTSVTITGSGFIGTTRITFGVQSSTDHAATYSITSANEITAKVPDDAETGSVYLTSSDITCTGPIFTVD